jgi:Uncharacterized protein involved in propionate catabolism
MMIHVSELLCSFAAKLSINDLDPETRNQTRMYIADYYAACIAGYKVNRSFNEAVLSIIKETGGAPQASILFEKEKYPSGTAAFMNAVYSHGADMDDGNKLAAGHIGTHVLSSVFALAEQLNVLWEDVFAAVIVGYEFFNRIAGAAQPSLYNKGFHSTGVAGAIACAAACAKLIGLDSEGIYKSVSLAAVQSGGLIIIDESGQECKPVNPANAARTGVYSALLGEKGVNAPLNPLESKKGWFHAYSEGFDESILLRDLGKRFTICESYIKLYPTCRHTHAVIDAALKIRNKLETSLEHISRIEEICVFIYPSAIKSAGSIRIPATAGEAKFSICYVLAVALKTGGFTLHNIDVTNIDVDLQNLIGKIHLVEDTSMENRSRNIRGCRVKVTVDNGELYEETVLSPQGEGVNSLSWNDIENKMLSCCDGVLGSRTALHIVRECQTFRMEDGFENMAMRLQPESSVCKYGNVRECE